MLMSKYVHVVGQLAASGSCRYVVAQMSVHLFGHGLHTLTARASGDRPRPPTLSIQSVYFRLALASGTMMSPFRGDDVFEGGFRGASIARRAVPLGVSLTFVTDPRTLLRRHPPPTRAASTPISLSAKAFRHSLRLTAVSSVSYALVTASTLRASRVRYSRSGDSGAMWSEATVGAC